MPEAPARAASHASEPEGTYAWVRLAAAVALSTIGGVGMWSYVVALPAVQADLGIDRASASLPYSAIMLGFGIGGIVMGKLADRYGIVIPLLIGAVSLGLGYVATGLSQNLWQFTLAEGLVVGMLGSSTVFGPMMADTSKWFTRRRGIAVGICASGNYVAGTVWPPIVQHFIETSGWRATHIGIGIFCMLAMLPLLLIMRRPPPAQQTIGAVGASGFREGTSEPLSPQTLMVLLSIAGLACCLAMSMPQVHLVAYCGDLGYGPARGAEMLSLMMAMGVVSRLASGVICDRIGGLSTLLLGSVLQGIALVMYLPSTALTSLYVVSALFGLFQGGIVPSYAIIVREHFPAREAGVRIGVVIFATLIGMAGGGWLAGRIYDATGSYQAAFIHGIAWNVVNGAITGWLLWKLGRRGGSQWLDAARPA